MTWVAEPCLPVSGPQGVNEIRLDEFLDEDPNSMPEGPRGSSLAVKVNGHVRAKSYSARHTDTDGRSGSSFWLGPWVQAAALTRSRGMGQSQGGGSPARAGFTLRAIYKSVARASIATLTHAL